MSTVLKWGLITGMVYIAFSLINNLLGLQEAGNMGVMLLFNGVLMFATFGTIYMGVKEERDELAGQFFTTGQGFITGFKIALIAAVMAAVFTLIYLQVIDPDMMDRMMTQAEEKWDEMGVPEENREMGRKFQGYFTNPFIMSAFVLLSVVMWGAIKSLVAALMLKKNPATMPMA